MRSPTVTLELMKSCIAFTGLTLFGLFSFAGGADGGGGGRVTPSTQSYIPTNIIFAQEAETNFDHTFKESNTPFVQCPKNKKNIVKQLPILNEKLNSIVTISIPKPTRNKTAIEMLCQNKLYYNAYERLMAGLYMLVDSEAFNALTEKTVSLTGKKIQFLLSKRSRKVRAGNKPLFGFVKFIRVPSYTEEFSWFNPSNMDIHWAGKPNKAPMLDLIMGRKNASIIMHEIAHVYAHNKLARSKNQKSLHDYNKEPKVFESGMEVKDNVLDIKSDQYSAFVESFANLMEMGTFLNHPMINDTSIHTSFLQNNNTVCAPMDPSHFHRSYEDLSSNEVYISSNLKKLLQKWAITKGSSNRVAVNVKAQIALMDALEPSSDKDLLANTLNNFDRIRGNDHAKRLMKEYFYFNISKNEDMRPLFKVAESGHPLAPTRYCDELYYRAVFNKSRDDARDEYNLMLAQSVDREKLVTYIDNVIAEKQAFIKMITDNLADHKAHAAIAKKYLISIHFGEENLEEPTGFDMEVYHTFSKKYHDWAPLANIWSACDDLVNKESPIENAIFNMNRSIGWYEENKKNILNLESTHPDFVEDVAFISEDMESPRSDRFVFNWQVLELVIDLANSKQQALK